MKQKWLKRYSDAGRNLSFDSKVLLGFNANINIMRKFEELKLDLDVQSEELRSVQSRKEFLKVLKFCKEEEKSLKVYRENFNPDIVGEKQIGGQAGIMANFLSTLGHRSILYSPILSDELADKIDHEVLYPIADENLTLQSVSDSVNSDRTKKNYIIEFSDISSRLILSENLRGFGPYFRKGVEDKFDELQENVDRAIFSGFHDVTGNIETKLRKSEKQLRKMHIPKHLEFVSTKEEKDRILLERIVPCFTSIGMDESELERIAELIDCEIETHSSLKDVYKVSKEVIEKFNLSRVHVHTKKFQVVVADRDYPVKDERIRESLLFGGIAATTMAEKGEIPSKEQMEVKTDKMHVNKLDELEKFGEKLGSDDFAEKGIGRTENYKIIAVPTLIHENPERIVGMGDLISSSAFISEVY